MKDQQSYFEKADFQSDLPKQFLIMFVGIVLVLFEVGLAQWPFFYGASPFLSLIFMYFILIYHDELDANYHRIYYGIGCRFIDVRHFGRAGNGDDVVILCHAHGDFAFATK